MDTSLRPGEAALMLGISTANLKYIADQGGIKTFRTAGGHRRYPRKGIEWLVMLRG